MNKKSFKARKLFKEIKALYGRSKVKLNSSQKEQLPIMGNFFYHEFDCQLIQKACLEYWQIHNFNWENRTYKYF